MRYFSGLLVVFMLWSCQNGKRQQVYDLAFLRSRNVTCGTPKASLASIFPLRAIEDSLVIIDHPRYLEAGKSSGIGPNSSK